MPFRFACTRCGHCCSGGSGFVWLAPGEIERMAAVLGMTGERFAARHVREVEDPSSGERRLSLREEAAGGGRCSLLVGRNTCSVYEARPEHCRRFPYWERVLGDADAFETARATCPGIAVVVEEGLRRRAAQELLSFHRELEREIGPAPAPGGGCCLDTAPEELFATGMEADHAAAGRAESDPAAPGCRLGRARPLACRLAAANAAPELAERWQARLRALERGLGYPASYGPLRELLRARPGGPGP